MRTTMLLLIIVSILPLHAPAKENIRGVFFENPSPFMLGARLINRRKRIEEHYLIQPNSKEHIDTANERFTLSAQLITSSFPIDCCEWTIVDSGDTVIIEYLEDKNKCWCKIK